MFCDVSVTSEQSIMKHFPLFFLKEIESVGVAERIKIGF